VNFGQKRVGEPFQRRAAVGFHHTQDVGVDVAHDHRRMLHRQLIHRLGFQFDPADPVGPPGRDDLHRTRPRPAQELAADLAQADEFTVIGALKTECRQQFQDPGLDGVGVDRFLEQRIELGLSRQYRLPGRPGLQIQHLGALE